MRYEPIDNHAERKRILALMEQCEKKQTMQLITIYPNNKSYFSEDFIKGFECGTQRQFEADKANRLSATEIMNAYHEGVRKGIAEAYEAYGAERPHGYWIKLGPAEYRCSECGKIQYADDSNELNFCCCCGSDNMERSKI